MTHLSIGQLREAIQIKEQIEKLEARLLQILGGKAAAVPVDKRKVSRKMSAEARAKIGAAAKARWAKTKAASAPVAKRATAKTAKKQSGLTAEGRSKLSASMKARWAARKKGGAAPNSPAA